MEMKDLKYKYYKLLIWYEKGYLHASNLLNIDNDGTIQWCKYSKKRLSHLVIAGLEKEHQLGHSQSESLVKCFIIPSMNNQ